MANIDQIKEQVGISEKPGTQVETRAGDNIVSFIHSMKDEIAKALPSHITPDKMIRVATTLLRQTPLLQQCTTMSFVGALMQASALGLEPGPLGHAYFVPFKNGDTKQYEVVFIPGYKGLMNLAWRSGQLETIIARTVYTNDEFTVSYGTSDSIHHVPTIDGDAGKPRAYYAIAKYKNGGYNFVVLSPADIERYRRRSRAASKGPWVTDFEAMAWKTCIRRLSTWMPLSTEWQAFARAVELDNKVTRTFDLDLVQDADDVIEATVVPVDPSTPPTDDGDNGPEPEQLDIDVETGEVLPPRASS